MMKYQHIISSNGNLKSWLLRNFLLSLIMTSLPRQTNKSKPMGLGSYGSLSLIKCKMKTTSTESLRQG